MLKLKKKLNRAQAPARETSLSPELVSMFMTFQEKLNSPVFNGGFDKLLTKIENIEAAHKQTATLVETMHRAMYEPDDGLFSRIRRVESLNTSEIQKVASSQTQMKEDIEEMKVTRREGASLVNEVKDLKAQVDTLVAWREGIGKKLWVLVPVILTLLGKIGWDVIAAHVVFK